MKNINDLMNKIINSIENFEDLKISLADEKKSIMDKNEELNNQIDVLENAINDVKRKKIIYDVIILVIMIMIYTSFIIFTNLLQTDALKIVTLILTIDMVVNITRVINKKISDHVAKDYNYIDFYSLYQQYNTLKREIKANNLKISDIEVEIDKDNNEISRLYSIKDNIDVILSEDNSSDIIGSTMIHNSLEKKYTSIL